jgi:parvulin-like peptidyl-prolyl isomerase
MKNIFFLAFLFLSVIFSCSGEKTIPKLSTEYFNYSDELISSMRKLSLQVNLLNPDNEIVLVETSKFLITNKYLLPFIFENLKKSKRDLSEKELLQMISFFAADTAMNMLIFFEASEQPFSVSSEEINQKLMELSRNDISVFKKQFEKSAFKFDFFYSNLKQALLVEKYKNYLLKINSPTEEEIKDFYDKNPSLSFIDKKAVVRQIFISTNKLNEKDRQKKKEKIQNILNEIKKGKKFEELVFKYSDDPATYNNGGKLGDFVEKGQLTQEIEDIIFSMTPGETSDIVESENGFHIFKLEEIIEENKKNIDEVKENIKNILIHEKSNRILKDEKLRIENKYKVKMSF